MKGGGLLIAAARSVITALAVALCGTSAAVARESRFFETSDGARLHYFESGPRAERTVVFVPGWTMPAWIWDAQIAALEERYHVLAFDPRGQGDSDVTERGYTWERRGRDISELMEHAAAERAVLVAWSLGVLDSLSYIALSGDDRIAGMVLVDNSIGEGEPPRPTSRRGGPVSEDERAARRAAFVAGLFARDPGPEYRARLTAYALRMSAENERALLAYSRPRAFWRDTLYATSMPVLYVVRPRFARQGEALVANRANARMEVFADAGHALFVDEPERFNTLLIEFLERLGAQGGAG